MERKILIHKITSLSGAFSWITIGLLTILSIINGTIGIFINLIMGTIFSLIGYYLYLKYKNISNIFSNIVSIKDKKTPVLSSYSQFLSLEIIFTLLSLLLAIIVLSAVISRAFFEQLPIFG